MCEIIEIQAQGQNLGPTGIPQELFVFGRITLDCPSVRIVIEDNANNIIFDGTTAPSGPINIINGVQTRVVSVTFPTQGINCGDRVTVTITCESDLNCTETETVIVSCKDDPPTCPDINSLSIVVSQNGTAVDLSAACLASGQYDAELFGAPSGSLIFWSIQVGTNTTSLGSSNPVSFAVPAGNESVDLVAQVIVPNCPPLVQIVSFPDRQDGPCPTAVSFELRENGAIVDLTSSIAPGTYELEVTAPIGAGHSYTIYVNGNVVQSGPSPTATISLTQGQGQEIEVLVSPGPCCPLLSADQFVDVAVDPDGNGGNDDGNDGGNDGGGGISWPSLCDILFAIVVAAVLAFIGLWIAVFSTFPASAALFTAIGISFAVVLAAIGIWAAVCSPGLCRILHVIGWMFAWCALGCIIAWIVSAFVLWSLLIGAMIAGVFSLITGLIMANNGCNFLNLLRP